MVEKLIYINEKGEKIEFYAGGLYHANVPKIAGLSDIYNTLYTSASMGQDGDTVTGNKIQSRVITLTGAIRSKNETVILDAKRRLSKILNPHLTATLYHVKGDQMRKIDCQLKTAPVYKRGVLLAFEITIFCGFPFWSDSAETRTDIADWIGGLEYPLLTGGLEIPAGVGIEMGYKLPDSVVTVVNSGDVAAGMRVEFSALGAVQNPYLTNVQTAEFMGFKNLSLNEGDKVVVLTDYGQKSCYLYRGEEQINLMGYWDAAGTFMQLDVGENLLTYSADGYADRLEVAIYSTNLYLGV